MDIVVAIAIVVVLFFVAVGMFYLLRGMRGPRKLDEIEQMMKSGKYRECVVSLNELLEGDDRNIRARFLLGQCYAKLSDHARAVLELRQCVKIGKFGPELPEARVRKALADALVETNNINDAKNEFLILTTIEPNIHDHFYQLGRLFFRSEVFDKAIKFLVKAGSLNDKHADTLCVLGQAQYHVKAYQDARASLLKAVQINPNLRVARYFLGITLRYLGDSDWALKELEQAERDEGLRDRAILAKGMILIDQQAFPRAITELQRGLKFAAPGSDSSLNIRYLLAAASEKIRDMPTAIENWEKIESLRPGFRDVRDKLRQYSDMRMDDSLKDLLIANSTQFEGITRKIVEAMGYQVSEVHLKNDSIITVIAAPPEDEASRRSPRRQYILIQIERNLDPISENRVRAFAETMKDKNAGKGILMTTGDVLPAAESYASSRPIELYDAKKMVEYVRGAVS